MGTFSLLLLPPRSSAPSGQEPGIYLFHAPMNCPRHGTPHPRQIFHEHIFFNTEDDEVVFELASEYLMCMTQRLMYQHVFF